MYTPIALFEIERKNIRLQKVFIANPCENWTIKLKADRPHRHDYSTHRQTPWTDKDSSLLFAALDKAEPLILTAGHQKFNLTFDLDPDLWTWLRPLTLTLKQGNSYVKARFLAFDLDLWPTTLTYNPSIAKVKVDRRYQVHYLPASL